MYLGTAIPCSKHVIRQEWKCIKYIYFSCAFFMILCTSLAMMFTYCKHKFAVAK
jgi:hypothetical protein